MPGEKEFLQLLNEHQKIIHKVCHMYAPADAAKEDLFQEVTLQAWKAFNSFKGNSKFSTWLYRVALNTAITFYRKSKRNPETVLTESIPDTEEENNQTQEEQLQAMYLAIAELSDIDKALVMLYLDDYNYQEMGDILGISANNVGVKINRLKTKLKQGTQKHYQL
ncbi:MAG: polymerase sigma factor [Chitinophagaceae bacterium]|nr:polymerase sigma factor [Chitinophagaceae bacterium]